MLSLSRGLSLETESQAPSIEVKSFSDVLAQVVHILHRHSLEEGLQQVMQLASDLFEVEQCSIVILNDDPTTQRCYLRVAAHTVRLEEEPLCPLAHLDDSGISAPIRQGDRIIGALQIVPPCDRHWEEADWERLHILALCISQAIHLAQVCNIFKSKLVERAVVCELQGSDPISPEPDKLAKIVAKSIFRELTQAGFGPNQIISTATEVLNLLQNSLDHYKKSLDRYKKRIAREG